MMAADPHDQPSLLTARLVFVFSDHSPTGQAYINSLCPTAGGSNRTFVGDASIHFELFDHTKTHESWWNEKASHADAAIVLIRHLDKHSLEHVKLMYHALPPRNLSKSIVLCRERADKEFKMSCLECGQKLWIGYNDVQRKGRCPQCKFIFSLPDPEEHIRSQLMLTNDTPILSAMLDDVSSCRETMTGVLGSFTPNLEILKKSTMRIQLCSDDTPAN